MADPTDGITLADFEDVPAVEPIPKPAPQKHVDDPTGGVTLDDFDDKAEIEWSEVRYRGKYDVEDSLYEKWNRKGPMGLTELLMNVDDLESSSHVGVNLDYTPYLNWGEFYKPGKIGFKANRLKSNDYGPDEVAQRESDYKEVLGFAEKLKEMEYRGLTFGAKAYDTVGKSNAFMGELITSLGLYPLVKQGAKKTARKLLTKTMAEGIESYVEKQAGKKTFKAASGLASEIGRTALFMPHRVVLSHQGKNLSETIGVTDKGKLILRESIDSPAIAWSKAFGGVLIENITEVYGGPALTKAGKAIKNKLPPKLVKAITDLIPKPVAKTWNALNFRSKKAALNGILEEYGEERLADLMKAATGVDDRDIPLFDKFTQALFPDAEQALIEVGIATMYGGISRATSLVSKRWRKEGATDQEIEERLSLMSESELDSIVDDLDLMEDTIRKAATPDPRPVADPTGRPTDTLNDIDLPPEKRAYKTHSMPMRMERPKGEVIPASAVDVMESLQKTIKDFGGTDPIRAGHIKKKNALGYYSPKQALIRIKTANNLTTAAHEVGHFLEERIYADKIGLSKVDSKKVFAELKKLGEILYGPKEPHNGYKSEGIAEFTRLFVTDPAMAEKQAPEFFKYFNEQFLPLHKKGAKALMKTRELAERWKQEGAVERAKQSLVDANRINERRRLAMDKIKTIKAGLKSKLIDMLDPIRIYAEAAEKGLGKKLPEGWNPYKTATALRTTHDARTEYMVNKGMIDIAGNQVGAPLSDITALVKGKKAEFTAYLWARRALSLINDPRGSRDPGISKADAMQIISELETVAFEKAAQMVYDWNDGVLNYAAQASPTFTEVVNKIRAGDSGNYVPLQREFRELTDLWAKRSSSASAKGGRLSNRLHGSGRRVKDIFPQMISNARATVKATHNRVVLDQMLKLSSIDGMGHLIEKIPRDMIPAHAVEINKVIDMIRKEGFDVTAHEDVDPDDMAGQMLTFFMPAQTAKGKDPIMPIYTTKLDRETGESRKVLEWYQLDKRLFEALDSMEVYRLPQIAGMPLLDFVLGKPTRLFRAGTTGMRASFSLIANPIRDLQTLYLNSQAQHNPFQMFASWLSSMSSAAMKASVGKENEMLDLFVRLGGEMAQPLGQDIPHTKRAARQLFQSKFQKVVDVRNWYDFVRDVFQFPESATRVTELKALMKKMNIKEGDNLTFGQSLKLLNAAKQVTTDFTAVGELTRVFNQMVPFLNSSIQGPRANIRAAMRNPVAFAIKGLSLTGATLALWYQYKDEEWYREMPYNEKFMYWYFPIEVDGRKELIRIPRAFEIGQVFASIPEAMADSAYRQSPEAMEAAMKEFIELSTPPVTPVLLEETFEQLANRDFFFDSPIVSQSLQRRPEAEQFNEFSSNVSIFLGDMFNVSPKRIDHALRGIGGSVAGDLVGLLGSGGVELDKEPEMSDTVLFGRLFRRGGELGSRQKSVEKMYELMGEAVLKQNSFTEETRKESRSRLMLTDAVKAVSSLLYVRGRTKESLDRDRLTEEALRIAQESVFLYENQSGSRKFKFKAKKAKKLKDKTKKAVIEENE